MSLAGFGQPSRRVPCVAETASSPTGLDLKHGLRVLPAAEYDQEVRDELFSLKLADLEAGSLEAPDGVLHDLDRAFHDRLAGVDHRERLLSHQHRLRDLRRVGQIVQLDAEHSDSRWPDRLLKL